VHTESLWYFGGCETVEAKETQVRTVFGRLLHRHAPGRAARIKKSCVDPQPNTIEVSASYAFPTTKGGRADLLPIAQLLRPFLVEAMERSPSDLVFPPPDGAMYSPELKLDYVLRRALGRAGVVTGYVHKCGYEVKASTSECGRCPKCNMRLWAKAVPRHVRFHDLRHTTATLLLKEGVPLATVQRVLRHTDPRLTTEIYGHLDVEDMRAGLDRLRIATENPPAAQTWS
jgi:integrase